jgi:hypothetical protein
MTLRSVPSVDVQPLVHVSRWRILAITTEIFFMKGLMYIVGFCEESQKYRISTAIVSINQKRRCCVTRTGRIYMLVGPSGYDEQAQRAWLRRITGLEYSDVSSELLP